MTTISIKLCINCKWVQRDYLLPSIYAYCAHPSHVSRVDGLPKTRCSDIREITNRNHQGFGLCERTSCDFEGFLFEPSSNSKGE